MTDFGVLRVPLQIAFGRGSIASLAATVARYGSRAAVVVDPFISATPAFAASVAALTDHGVALTLISKFEPELPVATIDEAVRRARVGKPDVVVGFGGGSAIDLAKVVSLLLSHDGPLSRFYGENAVPGPVLPIIAVPTTAGTGSEVTPVAVVSDPARELKVGISDPRLVPVAAIVDPDLSSSAPASVAAHSGADALVHAMESLTARSQSADWSRGLPVFVGSNGLSGLLALEAAAAIGPSLPAAVSGDIHARERMAWGSMLAGMAFGSAGTHLAHALQYPIGALTKTPHGLGTGMLMPYVLQACVGASAHPLSQVARAWGLDGGDENALAQAAVDRVADIVAAIGLPKSISELGVTESDLPRIVELASSVTRLLANSPIGGDPQTLRAILDAALAGDLALLTANQKGGFR